MRTTSMKMLGGSLALGLGAGALAAIGAVGPAVAATGSTATVHGAPMSGSSSPLWYDNGAFPVPEDNPGPSRSVTLTGVQNGSDIDFTLQVEKGPNSTAFAGLVAGGYRLDAFVRLRGVKNQRGTRFTGPVGTAPVAPNSPSFPDGVTINGSFKGVGAGTFTLTLTDLLLDLNKSEGGGNFGTPFGVDTFYNPGKTDTAILEGTDWPVTETVTLTGVAKGDSKAPKVKLGKIKKKAAKVKALKGTIKDAGSGPASVSVTAVQKRGKKWVAYDGSAWKKAKNQKKAVKKATVLTDSSVGKGKWKIKLKKVRPGKLVVKYYGTDKLGNVSKTKTKSRKLA